MNLSIWRLCVILLCMVKGMEGYVGVNWGKRSSQAIPGPTAIELMMQNEFKEARMLSEEFLKRSPESFMNSNITVSMTMPDKQIVTVTNKETAILWIDRYLNKFTTLDVNLRYLIVGENIALNLNKTTLEKSLEAMKYLIDGVNNYNDVYKDIKVTIPVSPNQILKAVKKPSDGEFVDELKDVFIQIIDILQKNNAPFMIDIYPIYLTKMMNVDPNFAFMDNKSNFTITDTNGTVYTNAFDFWYDACKWALIKAGGKDLKIVVGQIGWPTEGYPGASIENAIRFYNSFIPIINEGKGTPLQSGPIDIYISSLIDENMATTNLGPFERHMGIYTYEGYPKLNIDLQGKGQGANITTLNRAYGIDFMPLQWCVFVAGPDETLPDNELVELCSKADCSKLEDGGSCSNLTINQKFSYAFNMYYQMLTQKTEACRDHESTIITSIDPSVGNCTFPVAILSTDLNYIPR